MIDISIEVHGSLFDGTAERILRDAVDRCRKDMADTAEQVWQSYMDASFKHPTGYYQSHINIAHRDPDLVVNDDGVIYGPWLEGTGSRNFPVTRFKGYASARRACQHTEAMTREVCEPILDRAITEING